MVQVRRAHCPLLTGWMLLWRRRRQGVPGVGGAASLPRLPCTSPLPLIALKLSGQGRTIMGVVLWRGVAV